MLCWLPTVSWLLCQAEDRSPELDPLRGWKDAPAPERSRTASRGAFSANGLQVEPLGLEAALLGDVESQGVTPRV